MLAGYIIFTPQWFAGDEMGEARTCHSLYRDGERLVNRDGFQSVWRRAMRPLYMNYYERDALIAYGDFKSNPRRIHPFAAVCHRWYTRMRYGGTPTALILKPASVVPPDNWRNGLSDEAVQSVVILFGNPFVRRIQKWWRRAIVRLRYGRVVRQVAEEVAYRPGKAGAQACRDSFHELMARANTITS